MYSKFKKHMSKMLKTQLDSLTWDHADSDLEKRLRALIFQRATILGHPATVEKGKELFARWKKDPNTPSVGIG